MKTGVGGPFEPAATGRQSSDTAGSTHFWPELAHPRYYPGIDRIAVASSIPTQPFELIEIQIAAAARRVQNPEEIAARRNPIRDLEVP